MKSSNKPRLSNSHIKMDSGFDMGSIIRQTTGSFLAHDSSLDNCSRMLTEVQEIGMDNENADVLDLLDLPFVEQNISMMQKFIHKHDNDLEWDFKSIVTILQKNQKYDDTGEAFEHIEESGQMCGHDRNTVATIINSLLNEAFLEVFESQDKFTSDKMNKDIITKLKDAIGASSPSKGQDPNHVYLAAIPTVTPRKEQSKTIKRQDVMRNQFKEMVVDSLKLFIDTFIEAPSRSSNSEDEMMISRFLKQKVLQRRTLTLQDQLNEQKKLISALRKKGDLYEMAMMTLKHKIKALKWDHKNELENIRKELSREHDNSISQIQHKIKAAFDEELRLLIK